MSLLSIFNISATQAIVIAPPQPPQDEDFEKPFPDITQYNNVEAITKLKEYGIIQGYPDGGYGPNLDMNRAEFMKVVVGSVNSNPTGENCFLDVGTEWFAKYVCQGKKDGIVTGDDTDPRYFRPNDKIKFSEASKIVANIYNLEYTLPSGSDFWFKGVTTALENKRAIPLSVEYFDENVSRDEMAEIIWRLKDKVTDKASRTYDEINGDNLVKADSCVDLQARYLKEYQKMYRGEFDGGIYRQGMDLAVEPPVTAAPVPAEGAMAMPQTTESKAANQAADDYSSTNIQVEGVDEADVIKNDGKYIYLVKGSTIRIVEAYPAENMKELVSLTLGEEEKEETFYPSEMYVNGDTLTVIGSKSQYYIMDDMISNKMIYPGPSGSRTKVFVLDITDRTKPKVTRSVEFDGNYHTSRRIGDMLYMVMNKYPYFTPYYQVERRESEIKPMEMLPTMKDSVKGQDELIAPCNQIRIFPKPKTFNFLITAAVPLKDMDKEVVRSVVVGNTQNVYVSPKNLYVASTEWNGGYYYDAQTEKTMVYKFALNDGALAYENKGKVSGYVLNQFSMDESNDHFRIATTRNMYSGKTSKDNNLYVLDKDMKVVGSLENIAPNEQIYSVRFMGKRAYMVTFKTVDPLFVIDVSEPTSPKILGELKIPGYSNYLHPYDENHLIGFGKEVDESIDADKVHSDDAVYYTAVQGMKIGFFDVTDPNNPKEMFKEVIGNSGTESELMYNHKALLFDKEKELLAFPVSVNEIPDEEQCGNYTYSSCPSTCHKMCMPSVCNYENGVKVCTADCDGKNSCAVKNPYESSKPVFVGAYVYSFNLKDGFKLKGKITHLNEEEQQKLIDDGYNTAYEKTIQRILYIGENLYTVSQAAVKANALSNLQQKGEAALAGNLDVFKDIVFPN